MATRTNEREKDRGHRGLKLAVLTTDGRNRQPSSLLSAFRLAPHAGDSLLTEHTCYLVKVVTSYETE